MDQNCLQSMYISGWIVEALAVVILKHRHINMHIVLDEQGIKSRIDILLKNAVLTEDIIERVL